MPWLQYSVSTFDADLCVALGRQNRPDPSSGCSELREGRRDPIVAFRRAYGLVRETDTSAPWTQLLADLVRFAQSTMAAFSLCAGRSRSAFECPSHACGA